MDDADRAQVIEDGFQSASLARHREARRYRSPAKDCRVCGDAISTARRAAMPEANSCIDCARDIEARLSR